MFVIATPSALPFIDVEAIESLIGMPVRTRYRTPDEPKADSAGTADAIIVAPATYNTINKVATGASDTYALGVLAEAIGRGVPVVMVPFVNTALAARLPFQRAVELLRTEGVAVHHGPGVFEPHPTGAGGEALAKFPWKDAFEVAVRIASGTD